MPSANVDLVLRGYEALNAGDLERALAGLAPDFEFSLPPMLPDVGDETGPAAFRAVWEEWRDQFDEFRVEIEEALELGDRVLVMAAVCGKAKAGGVEVRTPSFAQIWTLA